MFFSEIDAATKLIQFYAGHWACALLLLELTVLIA
jgi:hypothetical protein